MELKDLVSLGTAIPTAIATVVGILLWKKQSLVEKQQERILDLERAISTLKTEKKDTAKRAESLEVFCRTVTTTDVLSRNVIILGPRASGKSSLVSLWCKVERLIDSLSPTMNFEVYDYNLPWQRSEDFLDHTIGVTRRRVRRRQLKIYDYAGEDAQIPSAVERIATSPNCTAIMVFNCDPGFAQDNRRYFSRSFVERLNKALNRASGASQVRCVYVVFNKIDLLGGKGTQFDERLKTAKLAFEDNVGYIETIFGSDVTLIATSANTNHNTINLLQRIVQEYTNGDDAW